LAKRKWKNLMKKVLVIGGKGFIGYHLIHVLEACGYEPVIATRKQDDSVDYCGFSLVYFDLDKFSDQQVLDVLSTYQIVVFAGGADDRTMPNEPAAEFFYKENVIPCVRLAELGKEVQLEKLIVLGSYFTYFNRVRPEWKMAERHPYVRSRVLQQEETIRAAGKGVKVEILELPYIFGASPDRVPLWKPLVKYINIMPLVFYTRGGTAMIGVEEVAKAIVGSIEYSGEESIWQVGAENKSWKEMIELFASALGKKRKVVIVPNSIVRVFSWLTRLYFKLTGKQSGLDLYHFISTQTDQTYMDCQKSMEKLKFGKGNLQKSIEDTVKGSGF
jgi:nucleoside-diphosphate-sugar epimerase